MRNLQEMEWGFSTHFSSCFSKRCKTNLGFQIHFELDIVWPKMPWTLFAASYSKTVIDFHEIMLSYVFVEIFSNIVFKKWNQQILGHGIQKLSFCVQYGLVVLLRRLTRRRVPPSFKYLAPI